MSQRSAGTISRWRRFRVGQWLAGSEGSIDNYRRVIDVDGRVPEGFMGGGFGPRTADEAHDWLRGEGVRFDTLSRADSGQRFYPWNWVDDPKAARTATAATIDRHSAGLPEELSALEALAASKLAPAQSIAVNQRSSIRRRGMSGR